VLTAAELQLFEAGDPASINPEMGVDEQAELLPYNRYPRNNRSFRGFLYNCSNIITVFLQYSRIPIFRSDLYTHKKLQINFN
jgi:hypothetical protein